MKTSKKAADMTVKELARYIDQSVLKPEFTQEDIIKYTQELICKGWFLPPNTYDCGSFVVN